MATGDRPRPDHLSLFDQLVERPTKHHLFQALRVIEAHYTIETDDGSLIYVVNKAMRVSSPEVLKRLRAREPVTPDEYYMRGAPVFDAPTGPHRWLSERLFVCSIAPASTGVRITVFAVT